MNIAKWFPIKKGNFFFITKNPEEITIINEAGG